MRGPVLIDIDFFDEYLKECKNCHKAIWYERVLVGLDRVRAQWKHTKTANEYCMLPTGFARAEPE